MYVCCFCRLSCGYFSFILSSADIKAQKNIMHRRQIIDTTLLKCYLQVSERNARGLKLSISYCFQNLPSFLFIPSSSLLLMPGVRKLSPRSGLFTNYSSQPKKYYFLHAPKHFYRLFLSLVSSMLRNNEMVQSFKFWNFQTVLRNLSFPRYRPHILPPCCDYIFLIALLFLRVILHPFL